MQIGSSVFSPLKHHVEWSVGISDKLLFSYKVYLTLSFISFAKISSYKTALSPLEVLLSFPFFFWKDWRPWRTRLFLAYVPRYPDTAPAPPIPFSLYNISLDSYIKPQRLWHHLKMMISCISFDSYIKPQPVLDYAHIGIVVYLLIPTSNHNFITSVSFTTVLYIFWFLHQTTTQEPQEHLYSRCISFDSYIKPQLYRAWYLCVASCISFDSYIKPQRNIWALPLMQVVYLLIPTSNHNSGILTD